MRSIGRAATLLLLLLQFPAYAENEVTILVSGIGDPVGNIVVTAFDNDDDWLEKPVVEESIALSEGMESPLPIKLSLAPGSYAFQVYHDLDGNGEMKTNFIGIPKEPTGVSNDAKGKFGPPKFKDAAVEVTAGATIEISMVEI